MQGRKGTPWAQPGLDIPPPPQPRKKKEEGEPQQGLRFAESPTCPVGGLLIQPHAF
jgi:hypothetical protein